VLVVAQTEVVRVLSRAEHSRGDRVVAEGDIAVELAMEGNKVVVVVVHIEATVHIAVTEADSVDFEAVHTDSAAAMSKMSLLDTLPAVDIHTLTLSAFVAAAAVVVVVVVVAATVLVSYTPPRP
jgi:hypothetical protein